jgi:hypothetical protein
LPLRKGRGASHWRDNGGARRVDRDAERSLSNRPSKQTQVIRAELSGDDTASALGITAKAYTPVIALCTKLIEAGIDPSMPLEAWRGDTLALRVRSVGAAARLTINGKGTGFLRSAAVGRGPYMRKSGLPLVSGTPLCPEDVATKSTIAESTAEGRR